MTQPPIPDSYKRSIQRSVEAARALPPAAARSRQSERAVPQAPPTALAWPFVAAEDACRRAWMRWSRLDERSIRSLPSCHEEACPAVLATLAEAPHAATAPYHAIATEALHALEHGVRATTPLAVLLLATVALERFDGGAAALRLAHLALGLAKGRAHAPLVRLLHAALVMPRVAPLRKAAARIAHASEIAAGEAGTAAVPVLPLTGAAMLAGMPLADLLRRVEVAQCRLRVRQSRSARELEARRKLLLVLALPEAAAAPWGGTSAIDPASLGFGHWLIRLQAAWYAGDQPRALRAALMASALAGPLAPPADLLACHLFAALALAHTGEVAHREALGAHCAALARWAQTCPANAAAPSAFAYAACADGAGNAAAALAGYEAAAERATCEGQYQVAALAWEAAAVLCIRCGFTAAVPAYRDRALASNRSWGAHGRAGRLCQQWGMVTDAPAAAQVRPPASTVGELGLSIAHEVNQPLAAIVLHAAAARKWLRRPQPDTDKALASIEHICDAGRHASDIVRAVQQLARRQCSEMSSFELDNALDEALQLLHRPLRKHAIEVQRNLALPACRILANRAQLLQVVTNLLANAIDALAASPRKPRRLLLASRAPGPGIVEVVVADNGPGIAAADRERIFTALFSTKANGNGVGLSICRAIVEAHGGRIEFVPRQPHGALFRLWLPLRPSEHGTVTGP